MKLCQPHWDALRQAIIARGLSDFISKDGIKSKTRENFDPLMGAHWAIANNAIDMLNRLKLSPALMLIHGPDHPERACPICLLNWLSSEHDRQCVDPKCTRPKGITYDRWIDCAADDMKAIVDQLPPAEQPENAS